MTSLVRSVLVVAMLLAVGGPSQALQASERDRTGVWAAQVMHQWEGRRAAAYARGDVRALRRLYSRASRAGARDAAVLREYADRGLVVEGLTTQLLSVTLLARDGGLLRMRVVERFAGGSVSDGRSRRLLPSGGATTRVVTLVRDHGRWVVRSIRRG